MSESSPNHSTQDRALPLTKKVLMVAYHFPPCTGSSGIQRTLKFSRYLPERGWQPIVLAPHPRAYPSVREDLVKEIHPDTVVKRTWAIDVSRHLSFRGIYFRSFALPDRWNSWILSAVPVGVSLIKKYKPDVIWCTYPIISAHVIALLLHRITNIPLVADFRDPMLYETWPEQAVLRKIHASVERKMVNASTKVIVTTPSTKAFYQQRYPDLPENRWEVISNGYDEDNFFTIHHDHGNNTKTVKLSFVHSGLMEPEDRDPSKFFEVLSALKKAGTISSATISITLRATGHDAVYDKQLQQLDIKDIVKLERHISYGEALEEMQSADGLLLFQGSTCNRQIPAKVYEYLRVFKPIFAMADPRGDTARLLRDNDITTIADLDSFDEIHRRFIEFINLVQNRSAPVSRIEQVTRYSRRALTAELASIFDTLVREPSSRND